MQRVQSASVIAIASLFAAAGTTVQAADVSEYWQDPANPTQEAYVEVPMPEGFQVIINELEGPVFANADGMTLYSWPLKDLRNGDTGDRKDGVSNCTDHVYTESSGLMSPYPAGLLLPDLENRPSCVDIWPPVIAAEGAEPVGKWKLVEREDGSQQWTYDGYPLYTSVLDEKPGDANGGQKIQDANDGPAIRKPVGPPPNVPPSFAVVQMANGRLLVDFDGFSVYSWDGDDVNKSNCYGDCLRDWEPVLAPETAQSQGEWTIIERSPGIKQWSFRGKPLYTYIDDPRTRALFGSDVPGWHNVYTQRLPAPPSAFTVQAAHLGHVLADSRGHTVYLYNCADDAIDQLACDHPDTPQVYRLTICGGLDVERCNRTFPPVMAAEGAKSDSQIWSVIYIDEEGRTAQPEDADALRVWAFRDRPVYTFAGDLKPGDSEGDAWGEFNGYRNGFKAFWLRDDFLDNAFSR